jgi:basic membrane lipoprotein Med (substrate-binding protein (PBP1-ABC) superfamily)
MVLKGQIVEQEFDSNLGFKLTRAREITFRVNEGAFQAGRLAGDRVNLNRPIRHEANTSGLLG